MFAYVASVGKDCAAGASHVIRGSFSGRRKMTFHPQSSFKSDVKFFPNLSLYRSYTLRVALVLCGFYHENNNSQQIIVKLVV